VSLSREESLSSLAKLYLGNSLGFYGLARYNAIPVPGKVNEGQTIRIPGTASALAARNAKIVETKTAPTEGTPSPIATPSSKPARTAADVWKDIRKDIREKRYDDAVELAEAEQFTPSPVQASVVATAYAQMAAQVRKTEPGKSVVYSVKCGELFLKANKPEMAVEPLRQAVALAPGNAGAKSLLAEASRRAADIYYKHGLIAFQHQDLDGAITDWNKVLAMDPDYKDAQLNLTQARLLKKNLEKLQK
jgi:tetratricopeptide (TPR) repeat protein